MAEYELILVVDDLADDVVQALYREFDVTVAVHGPSTLMTLTANGETASHAARSVVERLERDFGVVVQRSYHDLVSRTDIAQRCCATPQAVGQWVRGERHRDRPFPEPYNHVGGGVWLWGEVNEWLRSVGRDHDSSGFPDRVDHVEIDHWLAGRSVVPAQVVR